MADKNQQNILNGAPPQLIPSNPNPSQSSFLNQTQSNLMTFPGPEQNSFPNQKRPGLIVNGQISNMNVRNSNMYSGQLANNDSRILHHTPITSQNLEHSPVQMNKSTGSLPGGQFQKASYGNSSSIGHQNIAGLNASAQVGKPGLQTSSHPPIFNSTSQPITQLNQRQQPSPQLGNKLNATPSANSQSMPPLPNSQPVPHTLSQSQYQQMNKGNAYPYPAAVPISGPPMSAQHPSRTPTNELSKAVLQSYDSSSQINKNQISNPEEVSPSHSHHMPNPGSQASPSFKMSNPPFLGASQSFPPPMNPPGVQTRWPSVPQGYQPVGTGLNQPPRSAPVANAAVPPSSTPANPEQAAAAFHNQSTPNRMLHGPPPTSSEAPPAVPMQRGPPPMSRMPSQPSNYGNSKYPSMNTLSQGMERMSVTKHGFNRLWGMEAVDLLQCRNVLPPQKVTPPPIRLNQEHMDSVNCSSEIFCCTMNKIPETNSLLQKSRLPLGILIHPFRDLSHLAVVQCTSIVRCRACRTYINPFVYFVDNKRWKCNLCFRINELPDEFQYDPVSKTYGDPSRRPEVRNSTIEFIAPSEYMLRPPQPAIYLFVLDVSRLGCESGYLETLCSVLLEELDKLPGDCRTQIGFILFDSYVHFFSIAENYNQAHEMIVTDINDVFLPTTDTLLVNLNENKQLVRDLLQELPRKYAESYDTNSALGAALQAAYKLMSQTGGRITLFQSCLPNIGPGSLSSREDPNQRSAKDVSHLGPQTDFYKRLSLDCSTQQISVDLFLVSSQYSDLATIGGISQFSGGCIYHFPLFKKTDVDNNERLTRALRRYLTRKIGFEAVMRVRCSRGLAIHTFHGNFFVRSTDLLSLPNVNPDAGFGMQVAIEENLCELQTVCFQAAVLYTSAKGERRIRVHTLCLPVSSNLIEILTSADQQAIVGLLAKMAVDRSLKSSLSDAREAFINAVIDILSAYKLIETSGGPNAVLAPVNLTLIPLYILALLKSTAFRTGQSTRLDDRVYAMSQMKTLPLRELIQLIHPDLYNITHLDDQTDVEFEDKTVAQPPRLSLSSEHLDSRAAFLMDSPEVIYILVGRNVDRVFLNNILDVNDISQIGYDMVDLPELDNEESEKLRHFINYLQTEKAWPAIVKVITDPNIWQPLLIKDKAENALSYYELLHHVKAQIK